MNRSRRLVLAAAVVVLGLTACGNPNTTAPLADRPPVIHLANAKGGSAATKAAPATATVGVADSKIAFMAPTEFVYDGQLPALDTPAGSWFFAPGQQPDLDRVAALAASLGVVGDVRTLPDEQGGGWAVGPQDYSGPVLSVGTDGMLSWYLSSGAIVTSAGVACGVAISAVPPEPGTTTAAVDPALPVDPLVPLPPDVAPDCPTPQPPAGVPTKDEALAKAKQLFADWGYDVNSYQFDPHADEWGASVNASLLLDGMKAPVMLSVGFGENGVVTYASGSLATPQRGADYPTIGAAAGLERLKTQQNHYVGLGGVGVAKGGPALGAPTGIAVANAPTATPCEPEAGAVDCAPTPTQPVTVTLNSVKTDLTMQWATDNTIWLLPAYTFGTADGALYTVLAVDDAYIQQPDPAVATTEPTRDPGIVPLPAPLPLPAPVPLPAPEPAVTAPAAKCDSVTTVTDSPAPVEQIANSVVGLCLADAQALAKEFGYDVRVARQDGVDLPITADFSAKRINVAIDNGAVTSVLSIG